MEQQTEWRFQYCKRNILRCVLDPNTQEEHKSFLIQSAVFADLWDGDDSCAIQVAQETDEIRFRFSTGTELALVEAELSVIDVVRYTTGGEEPRVEIVKTVDGQRTQISNLRAVTDRQAYTGSIGFSIPASTRIFGLGQDEDGVYDKRGTKQYLYQHNMRTPMPYFVTDQGYGLFFDCASLMIFDDTGETTRVMLDTVDRIDFYLIYGNLDEQVSAIRYLTGTAALLPKWAFGYIQSRERYQTQDEMIGVAKRYRDLGIPLDCVVQDWKTWEGELWGQKTVDLARYPDLSAMNDTLHDMNVHSMVSVWPNMAQGGADHTEFAKAGLLLGDYSTYDAFSETARALYWKQLARELVPGGFDSWWCDSTEPFTAPDWCGETLLPEERRYELVGGEHKKYLDPAAANLYALMHARGIYENQRKVQPDTRVFNLTRSGYPGIQRYGVSLWAGDASARWGELRREIAKGINLCMCGVPFWTIDIGAFFVGGTACWRKWCGDNEAKPVWFWNGDYDAGVESPAYRELYTRWLQFGAFLPLFRSHGTDTPREIWHFGKPGDLFYDAIEKYIKLRYTLMPYIYSMAMRVALENYTMMRGLLFDFGHDNTAVGVDDEFMFGESLLICPVTQPMYYDLSGPLEGTKTRTCYLPKGCGWVSYWTKVAYEGGQTVIVPADIGTMPIFVRKGSILLTQGQTAYAEETAGALEVEIYPGADGSAVYYNDDGRSYAYQSGQYEEIRFFWDDEARQLLIREIQPCVSYPVKMVLHFANTETIIQYRGGEKRISLG